jgi:hypothetical protein
MTTKKEPEERAATAAKTHKPLTYAFRAVDEVGLKESHEV